MMGIFGTVSVFLIDNFPGSSQLLKRIGITASLAIFGLVALWIAIRAFGELVENHGEKQFLTEIGFAGIILCTVSLAVTILVPVSKYTEATELLGKSFLVMIFIIGYARVYEKKRYSEGLLSPDTAPLASAYATMVLYTYLSTGIEHAIVNLLNFPMNKLVGMLLALALFHLGFSEISRSFGAFFSINPTKDWEIKGIWRKEPSILIGSFSLAILTVAVHLLARSPPQGYYAIFGWYWKSFLFFNWVIAFFVILLTPLVEAKLEEKEIVQGTLMGIVAFCLIYTVSILIFLHRVDSHVIPM
ncbi:MULTISPECIES: hypothetical protein [Halorussus]|uniref:hypothetical protein n=1 Tax=Halorussus TaxID=1070314 RepID=UPI00209F8E01|nr:hypothetical protein [Halorussus vallis]USZ75865.1 hypothetical protein NGM07_00750 [Halorussus vallis]